MPVWLIFSSEALSLHIHPLEGWTPLVESKSQLSSKGNWQGERRHRIACEMIGTVATWELKQMGRIMSQTCQWGFVESWETLGMRPEYGRLKAWWGHVGPCPTHTADTAPHWAHDLVSEASGALSLSRHRLHHHRCWLLCGTFWGGGS